MKTRIKQKKTPDVWLLVLDGIEIEYIPLPPSVYHIGSNTPGPKSDQPCILQVADYIIFITYVAATEHLYIHIKSKYTHTILTLVSALHNSLIRKHGIHDAVSWSVSRFPDIYPDKI